MTDFSVVLYLFFIVAGKKDSLCLLVKSYASVHLSLYFIYFCVTFCNELLAQKKRNGLKPNGIRYSYIEIVHWISTFAVQSLCVVCRLTFFLLSAPCSVCNKTQFNRRCINIRWTIKRSRRWELILITNFQETVESKSTEQMFYRQTLLFLNEKQFGRSAFREETQKNNKSCRRVPFYRQLN